MNLKTFTFYLNVCGDVDELPYIREDDGGDEPVCYAIHDVLGSNERRTKRCSGCTDVL